MRAQVEMVSCFFMVSSIFCGVQSPSRSDSEKCGVQETADSGPAEASSAFSLEQLFLSKIFSPCVKMNT